MRAFSRTMLKRSADLTVDGLDNVPASGPVILAARHYHHQIDGEALLATLPRPTHLMVALDWVEDGLGRSGMAAACRAARWPAVIRSGATSGADGAARRRALRAAMRESLQLLREGRVLVIFPEGYPNVDPNPTPKDDAHPFLPFKEGFARLAAMASAEGMIVPIVPVGFSYEPGPKWRVTMRFGKPVILTEREEIDRVCVQVETDVIALSQNIAGRFQASVQRFQQSRHVKEAVSDSHPAVR